MRQSPEKFRLQNCVFSLETRHMMRIFDSATGRGYLQGCVKVPTDIDPASRFFFPSHAHSDNFSICSSFIVAEDESKGESSGLAGRYLYAMPADPATSAISRSPPHDTSPVQSIHLGPLPR